MSNRKTWREVWKYKFKYLGGNELKTFYAVAAKISTQAYKLSKIHIKQVLKVATSRARITSWLNSGWMCKIMDEALCKV